MNRYVILSSLILTIVTGCGDFYWRDYDGSVPPDAVPAGVDADNQVFYIGHAYLHHFGVLMGTIEKGMKEITIPCYGVKRTNERVQILCAQNHTQFYWAPVTTDNIAEYIKDQCPVLGGWDVKATERAGEKGGQLLIGRKRHEGHLIVGNIAAYALEKTGKCFMYYPYDGDELRTTSFEVLMYGKSPPENQTSVNKIDGQDKIDMDLRSKLPK